MIRIGFGGYINYTIVIKAVNPKPYLIVQGLDCMGALRVWF